MAARHYQNKAVAREREGLELQGLINRTSQNRLCVSEIDCDQNDDSGLQFQCNRKGPAIIGGLVHCDLTIDFYRQQRLHWPQ
jgi:hypothetical protein